MSPRRERASTGVSDKISNPGIVDAEDSKVSKNIVELVDGAVEEIESGQREVVGVTRWGGGAEDMARSIVTEF